MKWVILYIKNGSNFSSRPLPNKYKTDFCNYPSNYLWEVPLVNAKLWKIMSLK